MTVSPITDPLDEAAEELAPDPATFDLAAFVADKATFARYKITLHLAADEARQSIELKERSESLKKERDALQRQGRDNKPQVSLGETAPEVARLSDLNKTIADLDARRSELKKTIAASALTFHFAVTGRDTQKRVQQRLKEMFDEDNAAEGTTDGVEQRMVKKFNRDPDAILRQTAAMMCELTTTVVNASGAQLPKEKLTDAALMGLLNALPLAEITRINETLALAMNSAQDYDQALDAGFPG